MTFNSIEELLETTKGIIGKTFGEIDKQKLITPTTKDKGIFGKVVETGFYGYPLNNKAKADFDNLGVELKVSGFEVLKNGGWSAKERISLSQINYNVIVKEPFEFSGVISKNRKILFIWYEYINDVDLRNLIIHDFQLYDLTPIEPIIKNDYEIIQQKIFDGLAHELSEGDSVILGAATKGAAGQTQSQPYSPIRAKTRAFSIKNSFIKGVLREHHENYIVKPTVELSPEDWIWNRIEPFKGLTQLEILKRKDKKYSASVTAPKGVGGMIHDRILGKAKDIAHNDIFSKLEYEIKSIPIKKDFYPIEKGTFRSLNISEFELSWEESDWKTFFEESTFLYIGYLGENENNEEIPHGERTLHCLFKVTFTIDEIESFGRTYSMIKHAIEMNNVDLLPKAQKNNPTDLVISTKGQGGDSCYDMFMEGQNKTCFMFDKAFLHKKFQESIVKF